MATKDSLNNSVIDSFFSQFVQNTDSFGNKTSNFLLTIFFIDQLNQRFSDSHIKESHCFIPEWIKVLNNQLNHWFIREQNKLLSLWVSHWSVHSADLFESTDSFKNETSDSYEWVIEIMWAIEWVKDTNVSVQLFCLKGINPNWITWNKLMFAALCSYLCLLNMHLQLSYIWAVIFFSWQIVYPASFGCRVVLYWFAQYMISVLHMSRIYMIHIWPHMSSNQEVVKFS